MGFPPFRGAVRQIVIASAAIYVVLLLAFSFASAWAQQIVEFAALEPGRIAHGWIWQFVTYGFVYVDPLNFFLAMLGVYFIGGAVESQIGPRRFMGLYFFGLIAAAVGGFLISLTHLVQGGAIGAGAAVNAILMVFYLFYRNAPVMLFPLPIQIPVKYIVFFTAAIEIAYLLLSHFALFYIVMLLGLAAGYLWHALVYRRKLLPAFSISERYYGMRNGYYRWKRRRAAKKFQVYMKKHNRDVYFDEYGNYRPPKEDDGGTGKPGPWVN